MDLDFECESDFGIEFDPEFTPECLQHEANTIPTTPATTTPQQRFKLSFGGEDCILSANDHHANFPIIPLRTPMNSNSNNTSNSGSSDSSGGGTNQYEYLNDDAVFDKVKHLANHDDWLFTDLHDRAMAAAEARARSNNNNSDNSQYICSTHRGRRRSVDVWTISHPCVGKKVVRLFEEDDGECAEYVGQVEMYMPANPGAEDQLYKVRYADDDDEEDLDETEYTEARMKFKLTYQA